MEKFEILEHRGDFKIRAFGKTKEELFLNALLGMEAGLRPDFRNPHEEGVRLPPYLEGSRTPRISVHRKIKVSSLDLNALLVDFLSEALYLIQTNKEMYSEVKFKKFSDTNLEAELIGQKVDRFGEDIKAVTYHGLDIRQHADGFLEAAILFDV